jgi:acetyl-CoA carboxylase biotin carboxylase subunit
VEFLLDGEDFFLMEMNTRLQVEHPVTEMVTGVDLVRWQVRIASGERLDVDPALALTPRGHAIECRIYAEDPDSGFMPSPGRIAALRAPSGPGIRDDSGVEAGAEIPIHYDPMISKLVAWGADRAEAIARMQRALREYEILGIRTTVPFFRWLLAQPAFAAAAFHTGYLDELLHERQGEPFGSPDKDDEDVAAIAAALYAASPGPRTDRGTRPSYVERVAPSADGMRGGPAGRSSTWKQAARAESLRA